MIAIDTLIGVPFVTGGRDPAKGLDCWGLVKVVLPGRGLPVPDDWHPTCVSETLEIFREQERSAAWEKVPWAPWRIVAMGTRTRIFHVGVSIPGGRVLHTAPGAGVLSERVIALRHKFGRIDCYRSVEWAQ